MLKSFFLKKYNFVDLLTLSTMTWAVNAGYAWWQCMFILFAGIIISVVGEVIYGIE